MPPQVSKQMFTEALVELGHNPEEFAGKKLSLEAMSELYEIDPDIIVEAIELSHVQAHYDFRSDTIWIDALEAAHFFYCIKSEAHLYSSNPMSSRRA
jgi:hypothetical protein